MGTPPTVLVLVRQRQRVRANMLYRRCPAVQLKKGVPFGRLNRIAWRRNGHVANDLTSNNDQQSSFTYG